MMMTRNDSGIIASFFHTEPLIWRMKYQSYYYCIANHYLSINFECSQKNSPQLIPSYLPFQCPKPPADQPLLLELYVNDELKSAKKEEKELIRNFETGNGDTIVEKLKRGGYQYIMRKKEKKKK